MSSAHAPRATSPISCAAGERLLFDCLSGRASLNGSARTSDGGSPSTSTTDSGSVLERLAALADADWAALLDLAEELMVAPVLWQRLLAPSSKALVPEPVR